MTAIKTHTKVGWHFDNSYARLPESFFSPLRPNPVKLPQLIILNHELAASLGLNSEELKNQESIEVFAGSQMPEGAFPLAQAYAGHQFGHFTMLGDGRVLLIGEQMAPDGKRADIQLKGSGRTPYSRGGDGRAALGPMLREYIISEAMHALRIPTTRSLAVVTTGESVVRRTVEPGAVLTRVAASHIRVGTFQYAAKWGSLEELRTLTHYTLQRHFEEPRGGENSALFLLQEVIKRQAELIAKWQLVGFIHGVMNTDNMVLSGETIDYGPCAFMDAYDPATVFSSIDTGGRYAYGNQPNMAMWNLARFAETLLPLINDDEDLAVEMAKEALADFSEQYYNHWLKGMRAKLGLFNEEPQDEEMIKELLNLMHKHKADYTNTFRALTLDKLKDMPFFDAPEFNKWHALWQERQRRQQESSETAYQLMQSSNPAVIPRNHRVEEALEAAVAHEDYSVMGRLISVLSRPFEYSSKQEEYISLPPSSSCPYQTFCGT